jgi:c-di-GMP-binding flagellar brake protein YcgR
MENKRIHKRYQIIKEFGEPTQYNMVNHPIPGVLVDLSAGGMSFRSYNNIEPGEKIKFAINIISIATQEIEGRVEWVKPEGSMWHIGVTFINICKEDKDHINKIAIDYNNKKKTEPGK